MTASVRRDVLSTLPQRLPMGLFAASIPVFLAHNLEEAIGMAAFASTESSALAELHRPDRFIVAVSLLSLGYIAAVLWAALRPSRAARTFLLLGFSAICANALTHVIGRIAGSGFPGIYTSVLITIPFGILLFGRLLARRVLSRLQVALLIAGGALLQAPLALVALALARLLV